MKHVFMFCGLLSIGNPVQAASPIVLLLPPYQRQQEEPDNCSAKQAALWAQAAKQPELLPALEAAKRLPNLCADSHGTAEKPLEAGRTPEAARKNAR